MAQVNRGDELGGRETAVAAEIARFSAIADAWWDPDGEFRPLHQLNPVRLSYIRDRATRHFGRDPEAARPLEGLSVIDIGCGGGLASEGLALLGADVTGIDASEESVRVAELHAQRAGLHVRYRRATPEQLATESARFHVIVALEVVEHVADLDRFIEACVSLRAPGAMLIFSTLNRTIKSLALAKIGAEYILRWLPRGTHDWNKFVRPSELASHLRSYGAQVTDLTGVTYDPLRGSWALSRDLSVNYMAVAA